MYVCGASEICFEASRTMRCAKNSPTVRAFSQLKPIEAALTRKHHLISNESPIHVIVMMVVVLESRFIGGGRDFSRRRLLSSPLEPLALFIQWNPTPIYGHEVCLSFGGWLEPSHQKVMGGPSSSPKTGCQMP